MSILRKIPKIEQVLDNMSIESLKRLESLMNSGNGATETYTLFGGENKLNYENKDLGVWYCNIELERNKSVETGFLIWESQTKALFISYDITQCLKEYEIDLTNYTYTKINEKLSIEEFRRVLEDNINKEVVHIDTSGNVEVGKNLVVDGKIILNGKADLVDTSGNELLGGSEKHLYVYYLTGFKVGNYPKAKFYIVGYLDHIIDGLNVNKSEYYNVNSSTFAKVLGELFNYKQANNFFVDFLQKDGTSPRTKNLLYNFYSSSIGMTIMLYSYDNDGVQYTVLEQRDSSSCDGEIFIKQIF